MVNLTHDRFGHDWTLSEARTFVQHCYDRDALLETLINFGSTWLKGRLICLVTHHQIQPFMARGWASWGDDQEATEELSQNKLKVDPQSVIATVIQEGTYTFGSPEVLGIEGIFEETSVLSPEHVMVLPIQIGASTKMIFFGEPAFEVSDLMAFSEQAEPLVILADDIAEQLEEIIKLSKARKLPPAPERIPAAHTKHSEPIEAPVEPSHDEEGEGDKTLQTSELSTKLLESELEATLEAAQDALLSSEAELSNPLDDSDLPLLFAEQPTLQLESEPAPVAPKIPQAAILTRKTRQLQRPEDLKPTPTQETETGRPRPISYDPDDKTGLKGEPTGVNIMQPIGVSDGGFNAKQTLLGGFSIEDIQRTLSGQGGAIYNPRMQPTLQGLTPAKRVNVTERLEPATPSITERLEPIDGSELKSSSLEEQRSEPMGRKTHMIVVSSEILSQDVKAQLPSTKRMYAIEQRTLMNTPDPAAADEPNVQPNAQPTDEPKKNLLALKAPSSPPEPIIEDEISEVEALPTLELELVPSDEDEPIGQILGSMVSGVSFTGQHEAISNASLGQAGAAQERSQPDEEDDLEAGHVPRSVQTDRLHAIQGLSSSSEASIHYRAPAATEEVVAIDVKLFMDKLSDKRREASFAVADEAIPHKPLIEALVESFPGRLYEDRYNYSADRLPPVDMHGPILRALIHIGEPVLPYLNDLFESGSLEVRFYATFLLTQLPAGDHLSRLVDRLVDRDVQTREVAKLALANNLHHPKLEQQVLIPLRAQLTPSADEFTVELLADTLGRLHDRESVPLLIKTFNQRRARTSQIIHRALQRITLQPLPASQVAWNTWWSSAQNETRQEWLLRALNSPTDPIREMAADELRTIPNMPVHYDPHHPPQLRQHAQQELKRFFDRSR